MAVKKAKTEVVSWEAELAEAAKEAETLENEQQIGSNMISLKSGVLSYKDVEAEDNQMGVIILDYIFENVFYEGTYDPDEPAGPVCFAFSRSGKNMAPHDKAETPQETACEFCYNNEWGSSNSGNGKACKTTRRLAVIDAGYFEGRNNFEAETDPNEITTSEIMYMKLPVTSINLFSAYVKGVAALSKRPAHGVFTRIRVVPDSKTQFKVTFENLGEIPSELMEAVMAKRKEAQFSIDFPYVKIEKKEKAQSKGRTQAKGRTQPQSRVQSKQGTKAAIPPNARKPSAKGRF